MLENEGTSDEITNDEPSVADEPSPTPGAIESEPSPGEYEPNYSYSVKGEDFSFDERLHPIIKDKGTEEFLRDTFTRAQGLDSVKSRLETYEKDFGSLQEQHAATQNENNGFRTTLERLNQLKDQDPHAFQRQWGLPDKWVLDRATEILEYNENPAQARAVERAYEDRAASWQHEQDLHRETEKSQQIEQQLHGMKMEQAMRGQDVNDFAKNYDKRMGEGAFRSQVNEYGSLQYYQNKRYVDPQVCVAEVYGKLRNIFGEPAVSLNPSAGGAPSEVSRIPNLGRGRSGSPTTKRFNTLAELRAHAAALGAG